MKRTLVYPSILSSAHSSISLVLVAVHKLLFALCHSHGEGGRVEMKGHSCIYCNYTRASSHFRVRA